MGIRCIHYRYGNSDVANYCSFCGGLENFAFSVHLNTHMINLQRKMDRHGGELDPMSFKKRQWQHTINRKTSIMELVSTGHQTLALVKCIKEALNIGIRESKDLIDECRPSHPVILKETTSYDEADGLKNKLERVAMQQYVYHKNS